MSLWLLLQPLLPFGSSDHRMPAQHTRLLQSTFGVLSGAFPRVQSVLLVLFCRDHLQPWLFLQQWSRKKPRVFLAKEQNLFLLRKEWTYGLCVHTANTTSLKQLYLTVTCARSKRGKMLTCKILPNNVTRTKLRPRPGISVRLGKVVSRHALSADIMMPVTMHRSDSYSIARCFLPSIPQYD